MDPLSSSEYVQRRPIDHKIHLKFKTNDYQNLAVEKNPFNFLKHNSHSSFFFSFLIRSLMINFSSLIFLTSEIIIQINPQLKFTL